MNRELVYRNLVFLVLPFLLFPIDQLMASDLRRHSSLIFDAWHSLFPGSRVETKVISGIQIKCVSNLSHFYVNLSEQTYVLVRNKLSMLVKI